MTKLRRMPQRLLEGAPAHVFDIFDEPDSVKFDRYTIVYRPFLSRGETWVPYLTASDDPHDCVGRLDEMTARELGEYRDRAGRSRISWGDLPDAVQRAVMDYLQN